MKQTIALALLLLLGHLGLAQQGAAWESQPTVDFDQYCRESTNEIIVSQCRDYEIALKLQQELAASPTNQDSPIYKLADERAPTPYSSGFWVHELEERGVIGATCRAGIGEFKILANHPDLKRVLVQVVRDEYGGSSCEVGSLFFANRNYFVKR
jgi:hypothetical protein